MSPEKRNLPARERIMATAFDLFYRQGYRATGINQVIAESGVAKASFYDHFPSKEDLLILYAAETARREEADMRKAIDAQTGPRDRFFAPFGMLIPWFESQGYRGCPFQNLLAELPSDSERVREVARQYREAVLKLFENLAKDLLAAEPGPCGLDPETIARTYLILFEGAIATAVAYQDSWPVKEAVATLKRLLAQRA